MRPEGRSIHLIDQAVRERLISSAPTRMARYPRASAFILAPVEKQIRSAKDWRGLCGSYVRVAASHLAWLRPQLGCSGTHPAESSKSTDERSLLCYRQLERARGGQPRPTDQIRAYGCIPPVRRLRRIFDRARPGRHGVHTNKDGAGQVEVMGKSIPSANAQPILTLPRGGA